MATKKTAKKSTKKAAKKSTQNYGPSAGEHVKSEMHEMKRGKLKSGRSGKKVTSRKQAIAIGLSEARQRAPRFRRRNLPRNGFFHGTSRQTMAPRILLETEWAYESGF